MNSIRFMLDPTTGTLGEDDAKSYFSRFGWFAFAFYLSLSLFQTAVEFLVSAFAPELYDNALFLQIFSVVQIYAFAFPVAYAILRPLPTVKPVGEKMRVKELLLAACICEALMLIGNYISSYLLMLFAQAMGGVELQNPVEASVESQPMWMTLVFSVILAPLLEEIFFRGVVCKKLLALGEGYAVVLSAAFFALCHGNFFQLFYAFVVGCFFGFIYVKTGRLIYTVLLHITVNFIGTVAVTWVMGRVDYEALLEGSFRVTSDNVVGLLILILYEVLILGASAIGIATLIKNRKRIKFDEGILPPPRYGRVRCVLLSAGIAAAIAVFAFSLIGSLIL